AASPTYTVPFVGPLLLSTATLVGVVNWPAPAPGMPAWQAVLLLQTSLISAPSLTPHPQAEMNFPFLSNRSTRALPLSATYTLPFRWVTATPAGPANLPEAVAGGGAGGAERADVLQERHVRLERLVVAVGRPGRVRCHDPEVVQRPGREAGGGRGRGLRIEARAEAALITRDGRGRAVAAA